MGACVANHQGARAPLAAALLVSCGIGQSGRRYQGGCILLAVITVIYIIIVLNSGEHLYCCLSSSGLVGQEIMIDRF